MLLWSSPIFLHLRKGVELNLLSLFLVIKLFLMDDKNGNHTDYKIKDPWPPPAKTSAITQITKHTSKNVTSI